jgi:hypothetical protein
MGASNLVTPLGESAKKVMAIGGVARCKVSTSAEASFVQSVAGMKQV